MTGWLAPGRKTRGPVFMADFHRCPFVGSDVVTRRPGFPRGFCRWGRERWGALLPPLDEASVQLDCDGFGLLFWVSSAELGSWCETSSSVGTSSRWFATGIFILFWMVSILPWSAGCLDGFFLGVCLDRGARKSSVYVLPAKDKHEWELVLSSLTVLDVFYPIEVLHAEYLVTTRKRSCGKVMFSQACVILFTRGVHPSHSAMGGGGGGHSSHNAIGRGCNWGLHPLPEICARRQTVNRQLVRILLECIIVLLQTISSLLPW